MRSYGHSPDDAPWQIRCDDFQWFGPFPCPVKSYRICGAHQTLDNFALYMASWLPTSFVKSCQILIIEKKHHNIHNPQPKLCKSKRKWNLNLLHHPAVGIVPTASLPPVAKTHRHTHTETEISPYFFNDMWQIVSNKLSGVIESLTVTDAYFFQVQLAPCGSNFSQHVQFCVAVLRTRQRGKGVLYWGILRELAAPFWSWVSGVGFQGLCTDSAEKVCRERPFGSHAANVTWKLMFWHVMWFLTGLEMVFQERK